MSDSSLEGELLGLRLPPEDVDTSASSYAVFRFDDGGMKALAAGVVWVGLVHTLGSETTSDLRHHRMTSLVSGLLSMPTLFKSQAPDEVQGMIARIIKQNVDAKKLPVSSFEWCGGILEKLGPSTITVAEAVQRYNQMPEVCAHGSISEPWRGKVRFCTVSIHVLWTRGLVVLFI